MGDSGEMPPPNLAVSVQHLKNKMRHPSFGDKIRTFLCGHCENHVSGVVVAFLEQSPTQWLLCPNCGHGSVRIQGCIIHPPPLSVRQVNGLPNEISLVYDEARKSFSSNIYTGCEILCRKILMSAAVFKGASKGENFVYYVNYLKSKGHITESMKDMADIIRDNGNRAAHEIEQPDKSRAEITLRFTSNVLWSVYEVEHQLKEYQSSKTSI